ncbi:LysR family transcriptional regulator [Bradyrhizobium elkanii]|uniref:DNA-binding transcriptional LysR family regulator n=1 Tax=Bradyrhizobium elkanii TaxID=29448 RepID=A0ABV4F710_BRAEL|nr:LysR family transcriptional regulator [Bradyrhizobium elkanii]MBP2434142.1 DNA-binding transcriptional LysR family regulator [Bradyrhizobium elkanii]MCP1750261.1 DNA-binding transcriptional LysR family regulator [Bradyrhizobium elkanii]MCP1976036.1 DNA-binding transcriptional LysR family regulator [Bradyrhizobium elkanii]MCS3693229.1 DNA-binding transcriptional LysR family regulator [Bradyrhizobium elkanii]MCS3889447.1 DNA-binding transcriptional LysR family regulator [Bradyrhizobium elkani
MINLRTFDLNLLRVFEAIHRDRSVSVAADKLGLSQPAVSSALNRMRRLFDDPLFVRGAGGMEPTRKAMLLAEAVALGLNTIRAGVATSTSFDPSSSTRQFRIAMTDVGEIIFLPRLMQALARSAPSITVHVIEHGLVNYEDLLETGEIDIAIGRFQLNPSFSSQHIHSSNFAVVLRSDHPLIDHASDGTPVLSYESYLQASHITVQAPGASGDPIVHALGADRSKKRIALSVPHSVVLAEIVECGDLMATVPDKSVGWLLHGHQALCAVPLPFKADTNIVCQWWHKRNDKDPGHLFIRDILAEIGGDSGPPSSRGASVSDPHIARS